MRRWSTRIGVVLLAALVPALGQAANALQYSLRGQTISFPEFSFFAAPGERITIGLLLHNTSELQLYMDGIAHGVRGDDHWQLRVPQSPGLHRLELVQQATGQRSRLNLFVGIPRQDIVDGQLNGYRIGDSPPPHARYPRRYLAPEHYFEVSEDMLDVKLSPSFTLRQFLCKQEADFPKYLVLRESLLVALEGVLAELRRTGLAADTLGVISGYRTPYYNRKIGNVPNSRHVYGDAFDFYVDQDGDGRMDDLNGNGRADNGDVDALHALVERFLARPEAQLLTGGLGKYYRTAYHHGFVHIDTRGFRARW